MKKAQSSAVRLLTKLVATGDFDVPHLSSELVTDERTLSRYLAGEIEMPLEQQLCLAKLVIERVPALARHGHNLLSQVRSRIDFAGGSTTTHGSGPP